MKSGTRFLSCLLTIAFLLGMVSGCGSSSSNTAKPDTTPPSASSAPTPVPASDPTPTAAVPSSTPEAVNTPEPVPVETPVSSVPTPSIPEQTATPVPPSEAEKLDDIQRNSIAMLNYLTVLTQEISSSKGSRLFLEQAYSSLINNTYPNAVDVWTQSELDDLLDTLESFRMLSVKRERLQYIYEHNKAQAIRSAIPNPIAILSNVVSGNPLKAAASLVFMAVDSVTSYNAYTEQNDLQYLQDGWDLDDDESAELSVMRRNSFSYMINMVRDYSLPGDLALNENAVNDFVSWKNKTNVVSRISILEANEKTYEAMGSYWLVLAQSYYENGDYAKCLSAVEKYESITSRIFRKDYEYAETLPYAILSAQELYSGSEYESRANKYTEAILNNTDANDWASNYFVALIYMNLYSSTKNDEYLNKAYDIAYKNVNYLVDEQKELNDAWLKEIEEIPVGKDATKQEKEDIKQYNKMLKEERKTALPPISEPLYLNCELLFGLAEKMNITTSEKVKVDTILHENGENLFLVAALDNHFRFNSKNDYPDVASMEIVFDGKKVTLPAYAISGSARISMTITDSTQSKLVEDWSIDEVTRPKNGGELSYTATYKSEAIKNIDFVDGSVIQINIYPKGDNADILLSIKFVAKESGLVASWNPIKTITYERVS